jgi:hypothetical protein
LRAGKLQLDGDGVGPVAVGIDMTSLAGATSIGNSTVGGASPAARTCSLRHLNSMLALMPLRSAIADTDAPGSKLCRTNSCLNARS